MKYRFGKKLDLKRLKENVIGNPRTYVKQTQKRLRLFHDPLNLIRQSCCFICGSRKRELVYQVDKAQYYKCLKCSHVYLNRRLRGKVIDDFYKKNKFYASTFVDEGAHLYRKEHVARPKVEYVLKSLKNRVKRLDWLDIGAGSGQTVAVLNELGINAQGLEISEHSCRFAKEKYQVDLIPETIEEYSKNTTLKFDVISFFGVLEHLYDPMKALGLARQLMKKGGTLVCEVPNFDSFSTRVQQAFPDSVIRHAEPVGHMMLFTERSLEKAFQKSGFIPQAVWYFGMDMHELFFNLGLRSKRFQNSDIREMLYNNLDELQKVIDDSKLSDEFMMLGVKK